MTDEGRAGGVHVSAVTTSRGAAVGHVAAALGRRAVRPGEEAGR